MAKEFIDKYFELYPGVREYFDDLLRRARERGFVQTKYGRKRDASGLNSNNFRVRRALEREIINFPIQGGAADMMKLAMIRVYELLNEERWKDYKLLVQVHDELLFEVPFDHRISGLGDDAEKWRSVLLKDKNLIEFIKEVQKIMLEVNVYDTAMVVDVGVGENWGDVVEVM